MTAFVLVRKAAVNDDEAGLVLSLLLDHQGAKVCGTNAVLKSLILLWDDLGLAVLTKGGRYVAELSQSDLPLVVLLLLGISNGEWHIRLYC